MTLQSKLRRSQSLIIKLTDVKDSGLATKEVLAELTAAKKELKSCKQKQQYLINDTVRQHKQRMEEKEVRMKLAAESEKNAKKLKKFIHDQRGRPPVEDTYPDLHEAMVALASAGVGADRHRRTEVLNACHSLGDLRATLLEEGYILS